MAHNICVYFIVFLAHINPPPIHKGSGTQGGSLHFPKFYLHIPFLFCWSVLFKINVDFPTIFYAWSEFFFHTPPVVLCCSNRIHWRRRASVHFLGFFSLSKILSSHSLLDLLFCFVQNERWLPKILSSYTSCCSLLFHSRSPEEEDVCSFPRNSSFILRLCPVVLRSLFYSLWVFIFQNSFHFLVFFLHIPSVQLFSALSALNDRSVHKWVPSYDFVYKHFSGRLFFDSTHKMAALTRHLTSTAISRTLRQWIFINNIEGVVFQFSQQVTD